MSTVIYIGGELPDKDASALRIIGNAKALMDYEFRVVLIAQTKNKVISSLDSSWTL